MHVLSSDTPEEGSGFHYRWNSITVLPPSACWELNSGSLKEQSVLLAAEPSLQLTYLSFGPALSLVAVSQKVSAYQKNIQWDRPDPVPGDHSPP